MKQFMKKFVLFTSLILTSPLFFLYKLTRSSTFFAGQAQLMALVPGKVGSYLRVAYYCMTLKQCSTDGYIGFGTYFAHPDVELGSGYYFGAYSIIGMVKFGNHAVIGSHVSILSGKNQHGYTEIGKPILDQPGVFTVLNIGSNCWVGNNVVIMADLGEHTVVAAGSVVTSRSEGFEVIGGNPAKVLKKIKSTSKNNEKYY